MRLSFGLIVLAFWTVACISGGMGQVVHLKLPITAADSAGHSATIYFGVDPFATYCIDPALGEFELPPDRCGSEPICFYFIDSRPDSAACLGYGLLLNLRDYISPSQADTFEVQFSGRSYPFTFRWPAGLQAYFDTLRIRDAVTGTLYNTDMLAVDSLVVASPLVDKLILRSKGPKGYVEGVKGAGALPERFALYQNFPNPFNPATRIMYDLPKRTTVSVRIYDLLGRSVASVFDGEQEPGRHWLEWSPANLPAGIYYCRLTAPGVVLTRPMLYIR